VGGVQLSRLAAVAGYADQAHLTRECSRLAGVTPRTLLNEMVHTCTPTHDHTASYVPIRRALLRATPRGGQRDADPLHRATSLTRQPSGVRTEPNTAAASGRLNNAPDALFVAEKEHSVCSARTSGGRWPGWPT
jgi:hypothetical protein